VNMSESKERELMSVAPDHVIVCCVFSARVRAKPLRAWRFLYYELPEKITKMWIEETLEKRDREYANSLLLRPKFIAFTKHLEGKTGASLGVVAVYRTSFVEKWEYDWLAAALSRVLGKQRWIGTFEVLYASRA